MVNHRKCAIKIFWKMDLHLNKHRNMSVEADLMISTKINNKLKFAPQHQRITTNNLIFNLYSFRPNMLSGKV